MRCDRGDGPTGGWRAAALMATLAAAAWIAGGGAGHAAADTELQAGAEPRADAAPALERGDYFDGPGLHRVPSPVREALEAFIAAEFALERPATLEGFVQGLVGALENGGLSTEEAVRTAASLVNAGSYFSFADRRRMTAALAGAHPEFPMPDPLVPCAGRPDAPLPPGGVMVTCLDGLHPDKLSHARRPRARSEVSSSDRPWGG